MSLYPHLLDCGKETLSLYPYLLEENLGLFHWSMFLIVITA
jgi:hypothetical protein